MYDSIFFVSPMCSRIISARSSLVNNISASQSTSSATSASISDSDRFSCVSKARGSAQLSSVQLRSLPFHTYQVAHHAAAVVATALGSYSTVRNCFDSTSASACVRAAQRRASQTLMKMTSKRRSVTLHDGPHTLQQIRDCQKRRKYVITDHPSALRDCCSVV